MINPNLREELIDVAGDSDILNKVLDLYHNPIKMTFGVHRKKLWGVETSFTDQVSSSLINGSILDFGRGDNRHVQGVSFILCLKSIVAVDLYGFSNSPITKRESILKIFIPFLWLKISRFYIRTSFFNLNLGEIL